MPFTFSDTSEEPPLSMPPPLLLDPEDQDLGARCYWNEGNGYYHHSLSRLPLHVLVFDRFGHNPHNLLIYHISRQKGDNRRSNLRLATKAQNNANVGPRRNNPNGLKGG